MIDVTLDEFFSREISIEELRARYARLEAFAKTLVIALVVIGVLSAAALTEASETSADHVPPATEVAHGSYCAWDDSSPRYFSSQRATTPTFRDFQRFCATTGGELLWKP